MEKSNNTPSYYEKLSVIISQTVPKYLRKFFVDQWNMKFPEQPWKSSSGSGTDLVNAIPDEKKCHRKFNEYKDKLHSGNEEEWDTVILVHIIIDFGLDICDKSVMEDIVKLKEKCLKFTKKKPNKPDLPDKSDEVIELVSDVARKLFQEDATAEISRIWQSDIETQTSDEQCKQPNNQMNCSKEPEKVAETETKHPSGKLLYTCYSVSCIPLIFL